MKEQKDRATMEEKFYGKMFYFSYSGLNKLLFSPRLFYKHYILEEREERTDTHLIEGKVIHALLLDNKNFSKNFIISPLKLPSADTKGLLDRVFGHARENECLDCNLDEHKTKILDLLKEIDLHQSLKTDQQRLDKIITDANIAYYDFLKTKEGKDIIDQEIYDRCLEGANILNSNDTVVNLLHIDNTDKNLKVYNYYLYREHLIELSLLISILFQESLWD